MIVLTPEQGQCVCAIRRGETNAEGTHSKRLHPKGTNVKFNSKQKNTTPDNVRVVGEHHRVRRGVDKRLSAFYVQRPGGHADSFLKPERPSAAGPSANLLVGQNGYRSIQPERPARTPRPSSYYEAIS